MAGSCGTEMKETSIVARSMCFGDIGGPKVAGVAGDSDNAGVLAQLPG